MDWAIARAQVWELCRMARQEYSLGIPISVLIMLFFRAIVHSSMSTPEMLHVFPLVVSILYGPLLLVASMPQLLTSSDRPTLGLYTYLEGSYPKPVSTVQIVIVMLLSGLVMRLACFIAGVYAIRLVFGLDYPVFSALIFVTATHITLFGYLCAFRNVGKLIVALTILFGTLCAVLMPGLRDMAYLLVPPTQWHALFVFSTVDYLVLTVLAASSIALALRAVAQQRHGYVEEGALVFDRWLMNGLGARLRQVPFQSTWRAQWWLEFRRAGRMVCPIVAVGVPLVVVATGLAIGLDVPPGPILGIWIVVLAFCPFVFILSAAEGVSGMLRAPGLQRLSVFDRTQPISVEWSVVIKLIVALLLSGLGSLPFYIVGALVSGYLIPNLSMDSFVGMRPDFFLREDAIVVLSVAVAFLVLLLTVCVSVTLLSLTIRYIRQINYNYQVASAIGVSVLLGIYMMIAIYEKNSAWDFSALWIIHGWAIAIVLAVQTLRSLQRARRLELVGKGVLIAAIVGWLCFIGATLWLCALGRQVGASWTGFENIHVLVFAAGLLCIPLGSVAWAPLSLAAQRSR